jgi:hypothetical protein
MRKKLIGFLLSILFVFTIAGSANALPWSWDFTAVGDGTTLGYVGSPVGSSIVNFNNFMGVINRNAVPTQIVQSFTGGADDTVLDNGDTFSEFGFIETINIDANAAFFADANGRKDAVYIEFSNLSGYITDYDAGSNAPTTLANYSTNFADDSFNLHFLPGLGTIKMYLDQDVATTGGITELASFTLLNGAGTSPDFFLGQAAEGQFGIQLGVASVAPGFWKLADGTSFEDWMNTYGIPSIFFESFNLGATFKSVSDNGSDLLINVFNHGDFQMSAVPEPTTLILVGFGLLGLAGITRRRVA